MGYHTTNSYITIPITISTDLSGRLLVFSDLGRCAIGWAILDKNDPTKSTFVVKSHCVSIKSFVLHKQSALRLDV